MAEREVLIVDDDAPAREALASVLQEHGYSVHLAGDAVAALNLLSANTAIQVLLTDVRLPQVDGIELLARARLAHPQLHVILVTAFANRSLALRALKHGAADFLTKPVDGNTLIRIVERSFYRARLDRLAQSGQKSLSQPAHGAIVCDSNLCVTELSTSTATLLGMDVADLIGATLWQAIGHGELRDLADKSAEHGVVIELSDRKLLFQPVPIRSLNGCVVLVTEVTGLRQLQKDLISLRQDIEARVVERTRFLSEEIEFNERVLDTADVLIAYVNPDGKLERWNKFAIGLTGMPLEDAELRLAEIVRDSSSQLAEVFDPNRGTEVTGKVLAFDGPEGSIRLLTWSARRFREGPGRWGRLIVGMDVTEQKQLESTLQHYNSYLEDMVRQRSRELKTKNAQLIHTARLASLGEMVGSIAHEMKQPLNVIAITADLIKLLRKNGKLNDDVLENNLDKIRLTVERMANTINHLRGFTHIDSSTFKPLTAELVVRGALVLVGDQIRQEDITVEAEIEADTQTFRGDQNQIEQVLVNLLVNARDAVLEAVNTANLQADQRTITIRALKCADSKWISIEIADFGVGMPDEVVRHIFEPFFTTKDAAQGTGLGLSICLNIVRSHGGDIEVESTPGKGSVFRILLPVDVEAELAQDG
ncbi:MAG: response regulator [Calditrichaeota bacterium]|nr:response regulator [Calditrichota bacterium]MCB9366021.1 response regulator [Calditrichota bacterium]MCB9391853.1 response regulator [Calditrichota bacterium]